MDIRRHAGSREMIAKPGWIIARDDVEMGNVLLAPNWWADDAAMADPFRVTACDFSSATVPRIKVRQHGSQHGGLHLIETTVPATQGNDLIFRLPAILAQRLYPCSKGWSVRNDGAPIANPSQVLGWIKTETARMGPASGSVSVAAGTVSLSAVLDQGNSGAVGNCP